MVYQRLVKKSHSEKSPLENSPNVKLLNHQNTYSDNPSIKIKLELKCYE